MTKEFHFEDNSMVKFQLLEGGLAISMQARHLGKDIKFTSSSIVLTREETIEVLNWLMSKMSEEK